MSVDVDHNKITNIVTDMVPNTYGCSNTVPITDRHANQMGSERGLMRHVQQQQQGLQHSTYCMPRALVITDD